MKHTTRTYKYSPGELTDEELITGYKILLSECRRIRSKLQPIPPMHGKTFLGEQLHVMEHSKHEYMKEIRKRNLLRLLAYTRIE